MACTPAQRPLKNGQGYVVVPAGKNHYRIEYYLKHAKLAETYWNSTAGQLCPGGFQVLYNKKHVLNFLVHAFNVIQERYRFVIVMKHLAGVLNVKSDGISRNVDLASLGLCSANGWSEISIPTAVRQLLCIALENTQHGHVLEFCPSRRTQQFVTLESFVGSGMRTPTATESAVPIPWVAFRDTLALTTTGSATA